MSYGSFSSTANLNGTFSTTYTVDLALVAWIKLTAAQWSDTAASGYIAHLSNDFIDRFNAVSISHNLLAATADTVSVTAANATDQDIGDLTFTAGAYDDKWVCVVGNFTTIADRDIYIEDSSTTVNDTTSRDSGAMDSLKIGNRVDNASLFFDGLIAEVAVFDRVLTTGEIDALQTGDNTGPAPNTVAPANCIGYWSLDSDQATHADQSGNSGPSLAEVGTVAYNADHPTITSGIIPQVMHHRQQQGNS